MVMLPVTMVHGLSSNGQRQENHSDFEPGMMNDINAK